ncbi:MAG: AAA family ATPase, partial [Patescibacteria group bacterium]
MKSQHQHTQIKRLLHISLPPGQSAFLWGPRKVGKSTFLKSNFSSSIVYDLLKSDLFLQLTKKPSLLREELLAQSLEKLKQPIIIDEVQKVPALLDEVHWLIENKGLSFILCGSSARKVKRGHANLLGGRAWRFEMFPLVYPELPQVNLFNILNQGTLPAHYGYEHYQRSLQSYVTDYLKEEIFAEGLTRNIPAFSRFFEAMGYSHGEMTNYSNISRDVGVDAKTVKEYYQILVDTLVGFFVLPYKKRQNRKVITKIPKFYLFDVGVAGIIARRKITKLKGIEFGQALEHYVATELKAYSSYSEKDFTINYWRTKTGLEVDFILGDAEVAIEVKGTGQVDSTNLRGLKTFAEEFQPKRALVVSNDLRSRVIGQQLEILPWEEFLQQLWSGAV